MNEPVYPFLTLSRLRMETDGEGVTTLVAGAGCPLKCKWCLNRKLLAEAKVTLVSPQELYDKVKIDNLYFQATGGGVTCGGGEALLHAEFIRAFRRLCGRDWRIYAETSLHVPRENVAIAAHIIDGFIVDIKESSPDIYRAYTGGNSSLVWDNLQFLLDAVGAERITVRVPLIPEFNNPENQKATAQRLKEIGITKIDIFSYIKR